MPRIQVEKVTYSVYFDDDEDTKLKATQLGVRSLKYFKAYDQCDRPLTSILEEDGHWARLPHAVAGTRIKVVAK